MQRWARSLTKCRLTLIVPGLVVGAALTVSFSAAAQTVARGVVGSVPAAVTAFVDVAVIPMDRERVLRHQTVLVRGAHILALGPVARVPVPPAAQRIDGRGRFLLPGLADMHVHLWRPDLLVSAGLSAADTAGAGALTAELLFAYLASGVTTVRDMHSGGPTSSLLQVRQQVRRGALLGPQLYTAGDPYPPDASSPGPLDSLAANIAALKAAGHDFLKLYAWPRPAYDTGLAAAARVGLRVVGHVPDTVGPGLPTALRHWASIEHLTGYLPYLGLPSWNLYDTATAAWRRPGYTLDPVRLRAIAAATRRAGVWNCPTISLLQRFFGARAARNPSTAPDTLLVHYRREIIQALHAAGAGLLAGSDAPSPSAIHDELRELVASGLSPYEALAASTRNAAAFLGTLDSAGTIAVGKRADLVLLRADPLDDIRHTTALAGVMVAGRWLAPATIVARLDSWPAAAAPAAAAAPTPAPAAPGASDSAATAAAAPVSPLQQAAQELTASWRTDVRPLWP